MARYMVFDLDGVIAKAALDDALAPITCQTLWDRMLPFEGQGLPARHSGTEAGFHFDPTIVVPVENATTHLIKGDVVFIHYNERSRKFILWLLKNGWREVPAAPRRTPHFHINLLPAARKISTTRALLDAYFSYLYRSGEKQVFGQIVTFESRRGERMFERYGFRVMNRAEITKYRAYYPESVYLSTVIKNLETAGPFTSTR